MVSRAEWASANMDTFKALIGHLEPHLTPRCPEGSVRAGVAAATNRLLTTGQVGFLLGYLGSRVLGQYDVALLSAEQEPGRLLYVEENIRATARLVKVPVDDFRLWVALHETTHAFELEAHPVAAALHPRAPGAPGGTLRAGDPAGCSATAWLTWLVAGAAAAAEGSLRGFLSPEQRGLFKETQLVMSLMEGFSDWVMDEVGAEVLPDVALHPAALRGPPRPASPGHRPPHGAHHGHGHQARAVPPRRALRVGRPSCRRVCRDRPSLGRT